MTHILLAAFLIGVSTGLRSLTAPEVMSWAIRLGWLHPESRFLAFMGYPATPFVWTVLAVGELVVDKLPQAPSRKAPLGFTARIVVGALCGAIFGSAGEALIEGAIAGMAGAVVGTLGGYEARVRLARLVGHDLPVALLEDAIAIGGAILLVRLT